MYHIFFIIYVFQNILLLFNFYKNDTNLYFNDYIKNILYVKLPLHLVLQENIKRTLKFLYRSCQSNYF